MKVCPLCGRAFATLQAMGPHFAAHRRAVGINPPRKTRSPRHFRDQTCPRCGAAVRQDNLRRHLMRVHDLSSAQANQAMHGGGALTPLNGEPAPLPDFNGAEAITGVLTAARPDGMIPVRVIPLVTQLVALTDAVLAEVRR